MINVSMYCVGFMLIALLLIDFNCRDKVMCYFLCRDLLGP